LLSVQAKACPLTLCRMREMILKDSGVGRQ
jgi:hypothetical protein